VSEPVGVATFVMAGVSLAMLFYLHFRLRPRVEEYRERKTKEARDLIKEGRGGDPRCQEQE